MSALFIYMLKWACALTILYSFYRLLLSREKFHKVNRLVLLGILVCSILLPLLTVPLNRPVKINVWQKTTSPAPSQGGESYILPLEEKREELNLSSPLGGDKREVGQEGDLGQRGLDVAHPLPTGNNLLLFLLGITYIIGVVIAWCSYLWSLISLRRVIANSEPIEYRNLPHGIRLLRNADVTIPFSWFRWIVIGKEDDAEKQHAIIVHEMSHIQRWHSADMLLCDFTVNMLWWLPVSWMLRKDLRDVHEYEADSCVLASGVDSTLYQHLIIEKSTNKSERAIANNFNQSKVKSRLAMMFKGTSKRKSLLKLLYLLPALLIAILLVAKFSKNDQKAENVEAGELKITESLTEAVQKYARLGIFADGRALVAKGKEFKDYKYGYIDINGNEVIPCQYDFAQTFHEGRAVVGIGKEFSKRKYGYIDTEGKTITPIQYSSMNSFKNGYVTVKMNDRLFYIDRDGNEADSLTAVLAQRDSDVPRQFFHRINTGEYYPNGIEKTRYEVGFTDKDGKVLVPLGKYSLAKPFSEGLAAVGFEKHWETAEICGSLGFIDEKGDMVITPQFDWYFAYGEDYYYEFRPGLFHEGLAPIYKDYKMGYIDKKGKIVIPFQYGYGHPFSEGLAAVMFQDKSWGYIDHEGNEVFQQRYDRVGDFKHGIAPVELDFKLGFINKEGEIIIPCIFDPGLGVDWDYHWDCDEMYCEPGILLVRLNGKYGYVDLQGNSTFKGLDIKMKH